MKRQLGFTYLAALFLVTIVGILTATSVVVGSTIQKREKEKELLFIGKQFRDAIALYYESSPGGIKKYPPDLKVLLQDERYPVFKRYLRKIYIDPMTNKPEWGIVNAPDGGVVGVYSLSDDAPSKIARFDKANQSFEGKAKYSEWVFFYQPK
jgi:type II secretory pathway pseudopilin PulG